MLKSVVKPKNNIGGLEFGTPVRVDQRYNCSYAAAASGRFIVLEYFTFKSDLMDFTVQRASEKLI